MPRIDFEEWSRLLENPLWYKKVLSDLDDLRDLKEDNPEKYTKLKEEILVFFEKKIKNKEVYLASRGKNFDNERLPIDMVVIHHTSGKPGLTAERLSAIELLRLYAPQYNKPSYENDEAIINQPIYSGHFRGKEQVFWPYHWIVRTDGSYERLLLDEEIGWHAGKWEVNRKSVAIVLDNDYSDSCPSIAELRTIAKIIKNHYSSVERNNIIGHREVVDTICPSNKFLGSNGWKKELLKLL